MTGVLDRGRELEEQVAAYFGEHGYRVGRNVVAEGRSGARHEVDVLAEVADALTTYRVAVECKAWQEPVDQDVVSKLSWVVADLGLHKGIVVAPGGVTSGAGQAATRLGIEVWGQEEVALRLAGARPGRGGQAVLGLAPLIGPARAARAVNRSRARRFGLSGEVVVASTLVWLPTWELRLALARSEGRVRRRRMVTTVWHAYEALTGALLERRDTPVPALDLEVTGPVLGARVGEAQVVAAIRRAMGRLAEVTTEAAVARHAATLAGLGVDEGVEHVEVEAARLVHLPTHLALLRRRGAQRVVAVDARSATRSEVLGTAATTLIGVVAAALDWPAP
ncbi:MAG TPA: restriction endonuclease [Acidimicrobiales bacterium]|nr:restriction endonuclease [Acidimicrobiales bacterium]